jgi:hypothetical protein
MPPGNRCVRYDARVRMSRKRPNDPSSATRRTGRNDCNRDAPAGFAAAHGQAHSWSERAVRVLRQTNLNVGNVAERPRHDDEKAEYGDNEPKKPPSANATRDHRATNECGKENPKDADCNTDANDNNRLTAAIRGKWMADEYRADDPA